MNEPSVLLVVDLQVDFCSGGSLAVPGGEEVIPLINRYVELCRDHGILVFFSRDWHPAETSHFRQFGGLWPVHCVQNSSGARFHPALRLPEQAVIFSKGMDPHKDDYSTFEALSANGLMLREYLVTLGITTIFIAGLATDYCVRETSLDALQEGFSVYVLADAVRGVDLKPGDSERSLQEVSARGGKLLTMAEFSKMLDD